MRCGMCGHGCPPCEVCSTPKCPVCLCAHSGKMSRIDGKMVYQHEDGYCVEVTR